MTRNLKASVERALFLCIVTAIGSMGLFATDIYLAALPEMTQIFHCTQAQMQMSFTTFFLGLALCQFVAGALADYWGRKRVLVVGLLIFMLGSWLCAEAEHLSEFILYRLIQAIGAGVGSVVFRALIVDRFDKIGAARTFSIVFPIISLSGAIAPLLGGYLSYFWGWRGSFFFMVVFGGVVLGLALLLLPNLKGNIYVGPRLTPKQASIRRVRDYFGLITNIEFLGYALVICTCFCAFRSYTVESPFVFSRQGYLAEEIGSFYVGLSISYLLGSILARYLSRKMSMHHVLWVGIGFLVFGSLAMMAATFCFSHSPYAIVLPMCVIAAGNGLLFPIGSAAALTVVPSALSGSAAGLMGCLQFLLAALCISHIGDWCQGHAMPMSLFIGLIILMGLCSYIFLVHRPSVRRLLSAVEPQTQECKHESR